MAWARAAFEPAWEHAQWEIGQYRDCGALYCIESAAEAVKNVLRSSKDRHARRWQTKEGTYRVKQQLPPDVRDSGGDETMALWATCDRNPSCGAGGLVALWCKACAHWAHFRSGTGHLLYG